MTKRESMKNSLSSLSKMTLSIGDDSNTLPEMSLDKLGRRSKVIPEIDRIYNTKKAEIERVTKKNNKIRNMVVNYSLNYQSHCDESEDNGGPLMSGIAASPRIPGDNFPSTGSDCSIFTDELETNDKLSTGYSSFSKVGQQFERSENLFTKSNQALKEKLENRSCDSMDPLHSNWSPILTYSSPTHSPLRSPKASTDDDVLPLTVKYMAMESLIYIPDSPKAYESYLKVAQSIIMRESTIMQIQNLITNFDEVYWQYSTLRIIETHSALAVSPSEVIPLLSSHAKTTIALSTDLLSKHKRLKDLQHELSVAIAHFRALSITVVENITSWRKIAFDDCTSDDTASIYWKNENYLIKILSDYKFFNNCLGLITWLEASTNPFMLPYDDLPSIHESPESLSPIDINKFHDQYVNTQSTLLDIYNLRKEEYREWTRKKRLHMSTNSTSDYFTSNLPLNHLFLSSSIVGVVQPNHHLDSMQHAYNSHHPFAGVLATVEEAVSPVRSSAKLTKKGSTNAPYSNIPESVTEDNSALNTSRGSSISDALLAPKRDVSYSDKLPLLFNEIKLTKKPSSTSEHAHHPVESMVAPFLQRNGSKMSKGVSIQIFQQPRNVLPYGVLPYTIDEWPIVREYCLKLWNISEKYDPNFWDDARHHPLILSAAIGFKETFPNPLIIPDIPESLLHSCISAWNVCIEEFLAYRNHQEKVRESRSRRQSLTQLSLPSSLDIIHDRNSLELQEALKLRQLYQLVNDNQLNQKNHTLPTQESSNNRLKKFNSTMILKAATTSKGKTSDDIENLFSSSSSSILASQTQQQTKLSTKLSTKDFFSLTSVNLMTSTVSRAASEHTKSLKLLPQRNSISNTNVLSLVNPSDNDIDEDEKLLQSLAQLSKNQTQELNQRRTSNYQIFKETSSEETQNSIKLAAINRVHADRSLTNKINGIVVLNSETFTKHHPNSNYRRALSAVKIQKLIRGFLARIEAKKRRRLKFISWMVVRIQKCFRGFKSRKALRDKILQRKVEILQYRKAVAKRFQASLKITRAIRQYVLKKHGMLQNISNTRVTRSTSGGGGILSFNESDGIGTGLFVGRRMKRNYLDGQLSSSAPKDSLFTGSTNSNVLGSAAKKPIETLEPTIEKLLKTSPDDSLSKLQNTKKTTGLDISQSESTGPHNNNASSRRKLQLATIVKSYNNLDSRLDSRMIPKGYDEHGRRIRYKPFVQLNQRVFVHDPRVVYQRAVEFNEVYAGEPIQHLSSENVNQATFSTVGGRSRKLLINAPSEVNLKDILSRYVKSKH